MISWVEESGEEERFCARDQPAQPVPKINMRGLVEEYLEVEEVVLKCFEDIDDDEVEKGRFEVVAGVEVGVLGMEDVWLRVVGAIIARAGNNRLV